MCGGRFKGCFVLVLKFGLLKENRIEKENEKDGLRTNNDDEEW